MNNIRVQMFRRQLNSKKFVLLPPLPPPNKKRKNTLRINPIRGLWKKKIVRPPNFISQLQRCPQYTKKWREFVSCSWFLAPAPFHNAIKLPRATCAKGQLSSARLWDTCWFLGMSGICRPRWKNPDSPKIIRRRIWNSDVPVRTDRARSEDGISGERRVRSVARNNEGGLDAE